MKDFRISSRPDPELVRLSRIAAHADGQRQFLALARCYKRQMTRPGVRAVEWMDASPRYANARALARAEGQAKRALRRDPGRVRRQITAELKFQPTPPRRPQRTPLSAPMCSDRQLRRRRRVAPSGRLNTVTRPRRRARRRIRSPRSPRAPSRGDPHPGEALAAPPSLADLQAVGLGVDGERPRGRGRPPVERVEGRGGVERLAEIALEQRLAAAHRILAGDQSMSLDERLDLLAVVVFPPGGNG